MVLLICSFGSSIHLKVTGFPELGRPSPHFGTQGRVACLGRDGGFIAYPDRFGSGSVELRVRAARWNHWFPDIELPFRAAARGKLNRLPLSLGAKESNQRKQAVGYSRVTPS